MGREIYPVMTDKRRRYLERLIEHGPTKNRCGVVANHLLRLGWADIEYENKETGAIVHLGSLKRPITRSFLEKWKSTSRLAITTKRRAALAKAQPNKGE